MDSPKHGYEIKRQIQEDLEPNLGLKINSIYYPLRQLERAGYIFKKQGKQGNFPDKFIYEIQPKGKKRFDALIKENLLNIQRPFFQIDLSLFFLPYADKDQVKKRLKARIVLLRRIASQLSSKSLIHQHSAELIKAEIAFFERLIRP